MNYRAKLTDCSYYGMHHREPGDVVYAHVDTEGKVILFDPAGKGKYTFDAMFGSIEEAAKHATFISKTDFDVYGAWSKMVDERYW